MTDAANTTPEDRARALLQAVYANPSDLQLRGVLADALQECGDPRGEYIALELAIAEGRGDAAMQRRSDNLFAMRGRRWIGRLPGAMRWGRYFERGFLTGVHINAGAKALLESVDDPAWSTVEELVVQSFNRRPEYSPLPALELLLARAPSLRAFVSDTFARELRGPFPRIRAVGLGSTELTMPPAFPEIALLGAATEDVGDALERAAGLPIDTLLLDVRRAYRVDVATMLARAFEAYAQRPSVARLRLVFSQVGSLGHLLAPNQRGALVQLRRDDPRVELSYIHESHGPTLQQVVDALVRAGRREITVARPIRRPGLHRTLQAMATITNVTLHRSDRPLRLWNHAD